MTMPFEKILTPGVRAGNAVERVGKMVEAGVCAEAIAAQLSANSPNGRRYTRCDVQTLSNVYQDSRTRVLVTSEQAEAMRKDSVMVGLLLADA